MVKAAARRVHGSAEAVQDLRLDLASGMPGEAARGRAPCPATRRGCRAAPSRPPLLRLAEAARLPDPIGRPCAPGPVGVDGGRAQKPPDGESGQHPAVDLAERLAQGRRRSKAFQKTASRPPGRSTAAAFAAPATGSTQCQACAAMTASNVRPAGSQSSNFATSAGAALPGQLGHPRVGVHAEHPAARRLEQPGGDAGAAPDVEHVTPRAGGDDAVHQLGGIAGPGPVVAAGVGAETLGDLPLAMRCLRPVVAPGAGLRGSRQALAVEWSCAHSKWARAHLRCVRGRRRKDGRRTCPPEWPSATRAGSCSTPPSGSCCATARRR